ncbi:oligosaccharide flippase family protein [Pseudomonadales bacterium]|nr:oligosaccharide flippase family protein [Pseudomonadales bacterium]MDB4451268.1 oligosaccharide flippase family protein [Pseudomonadales bacterium]
MSISLAEKNLFSYVKKASTFSFLIKAAGLMLGLGLNILFARFFGQEAYGTYLFLTANILLIVSISLLGLDKGALKFIPRYQSLNAGRALSQYVRFSRTVVFSFAALVSLFSSVIIFWWYGERFLLLNESIMVAFVIVGIFTAVASLQDGFLQSIKKPLHGQAPLQIIRPMLLVLALFFVTQISSGGTLTEFFWLNAGVSIFVYVILLTIWSQKKPQLDEGREDVQQKQWLKIGFSFQAITLCNVALTQTDIIVVGSLLDAGAVALYGVAVKIASLLTFFLVAINTVVAPIISQYHVTGDVASLQRLMTFSARMVTALTSLAMFFIFFSADWILMFFGEEYISTKDTLFILCVASFFNAMTGAVSYLLSLSGFHIDVLRVLVFSVVLNLFLSVVLVGMMGLVGAALATTITTLLWNICLLIISIRRTGINPSLAPIKVGRAQA